jgi:hypothetical protein
VGIYCYYDKNITNNTKKAVARIIAFFVEFLEGIGVTLEGY